MRPTKKRNTRLSPLWKALLACLALSFNLVTWQVPAVQASPPQAPLFSPQQVIQLVNQVRASNGLPPYQVNSALMAAAQAHSEYQASIGTVTHTGRGGSNATQRAIAAGYGGGASVSVIENIYAGRNATPNQAVTWWQGDSIHLSTLLSTRHEDAGAGVAQSGEMVYYTLDVGVIGSGSGNAPAPGITPGQTPLASVAPFFPVITSTPAADGSIVHVVQPGQTLWTIAATYKVALDDLLRLNNLSSNAFIIPGQKILVRPPGEGGAATPTVTVEETVSAPEETPPNPTATFSPTPSPTEEISASPTVSEKAPGATRTKRSSPPAEVSNLLLILIGGVVVVGAGLLVAGTVLRRVA